MTTNEHRRLRTVDLAGVVYSAGKVFDGLNTDRLNTEEFLRTGSTRGVRSRIDLSLLRDLRELAALTVTHSGPVDAAFVRRLNALITRSGPLHPGEFRTQDQDLGVRTVYGDHRPPPLTDEALQQIVEPSTRGLDPSENAIDLFIAVAKAQPFQDGNKRTALFAANAVLIGRRTQRLLTVPVDEDEPAVARRFKDLLARAYVLGEETGVKAMLREQGLVPIPDWDGVATAFPRSVVAPGPRRLSTTAEN